MTSAVPPSSQTSRIVKEQASATSTNTALPLSGAVPAQQPGRSYASAITATQTPPTPAGASAPSQHAQSASESPVNGIPQMAQGNPQVVSSVPNGSMSGAEHGRKPSVVITASGTSGYTPNGGPVVSQNGRPPITFGNMSGSPLPTASAPHQSSSTLSTPAGNPRVISPAHSPSPIPPQPAVSGGPRPPSSLQQSGGNGMTFGSMGGDAEMLRQSQMQPGSMGPGIPIHERRTSSQSMQGDMSNMNRSYGPPNGGRGRGFQPQQGYGAPSPAQSFRAPSNPSRGLQSMPPQFQQSGPPQSPYNRGRNSPAINHSQPNMGQQHMGSNAQMQYGGYPQQMGSHQHSQQNMYPQFDPNSGYYQPYWNYGQQPPPSPRPYPSPYGAPQGPHQPPFFPPNMSRSTSTAGSERPPSSMGHPQTPSMGQVPPQSQTPSNQQSQGSQSQGSQPPASQFVKPKKTSAIRITDAQGNAIVLGKPAPAPAAPKEAEAPVIVSTPSVPTPPSRSSSSQQVRPESKAVPVQTAEERKNAFQEQVKRQVEEEKRKAEEAEAAKAKPAQVVTAPKAEEPAVEKVVEKEPVVEAPVEEQKDVIKEATVEAEKAAAVDAGDAEGVKAAEVAESAVAKEDESKNAQEETEDERLEREIAEMEAAEKAEEEREKAFQDKRRQEKEASAGQEAEAAAKADAELKRQEREAEELEEAREREREGASQQDDKSRDMFAALAKPEIGPGADAASGTDTPQSEEVDQSSPTTTPAEPVVVPPTRTPSAAKPKPANLKLETNKRVEPSEPTPGMQALKSARFLEVKEEPQYPDGFKSPNPAINVINGSRKARGYDREFLLQFQNVFKEKPSMDWDQKVRETLQPGGDPGSAQSRTPSSNMSRGGSQRPAGPSAGHNFGGPMGSFGGAPGGRTLPVGTTSEQRFQAANQGGRPGMGNAATMPRVPSQLGMGSGPIGMNRPNPMMGQMPAPNSPRPGGSTRGNNNRGSRRGDRTMSKKEEAEMAAKMPLTAHTEIAPLEMSKSGWKPTSIGQPIMASQPDLSGHLAPDLVQRKVKAALNKMTPEKFDKISDQILEIASQSKSETDGRTLRQVIQLTFEKACDEAHWAGMYAQFCHKMLTTMSKDIRDETIKDKNGDAVVGGALFRKYLLNRCQEEFERGWQVNLPERPEGDEAALLSEEYYIAAAAKRRGLGLIQFIGQLYKLRMLTLRIMHECVQKLLNFEGDPDESAVENLTTLLKSVGATMEEDENGPNFLNAYFERIDAVLLKSDKLQSRPRFMIMDLVDLRKARWRGKDDAKGPKTITQIHEEAEAAQARAEMERQRLAQRGGGGGRPPPGRGDARYNGNMAPPVDNQRSYIGMDDLRRLQNRGASGRPAGTSLGPGGNLGPGGSMLAPRAGSRRGASNLAANSSGNTTRTNTPPVDSKDKKGEQSSQNAFDALAALDASGEAPEDAATQPDAASPPTANATVSSAAAEPTEETPSTA